ncbi:MAG: HAMP domain-containing histidine kinase [Bdellovibrionales bacterium]|nr:HAMP domain-containing histidine kinase [Bdellovibrionales bacterium]
MLEVKHKRWLRLFALVAALVLAQVVWWNVVFMNSVGSIEGLRSEILGYRNQLGLSSETTPTLIAESAHKQRTMFVSESIFFVMLTCLAIYLLYRALKAEERSREIQKNFIEIVSHESKTPLTALKLRLESLQESSNSEETKREAHLSLDEVRRLTSLFDKIMNLNRFERRAFSFESINLSALVESVAARVEPMLRAKSIQLETDLDPKALVNGDADSLQNSIQSLVENSILYNDKTEKKIRISVQRDPGGTTVLDIDDNGPGIPAQESPLIFERFYRGRAGRRVPGTGLGLFTAKFIVEAHAGSLKLVHSGLGGTHFQIELPRGSA